MNSAVMAAKSQHIYCYVPRTPMPGETILGSKFLTGFGGKGANQCICAARLGAKTAMIAKVGEDRYGRDYIQNLQDSGVNIDFVLTTKEASTGVASIAVTEDGQNAIIVVGGANMLLTEADLKAARNTIKSAKVVVCQLEISPDITLAAMRMARDNGVTTILNPAPVQTGLPDEMLTLSDIFIPNESEAATLTGMPVESVSDAKKASSLLLSWGCKTVIITLGEQGAVVASKDGIEATHIPAKDVTAIDTTGAGDAFVGGLAFYLSTMPELQLTEMIRRAGEIATISVQATGTQSSYPRRQDMNEQLFSWPSILH